MVAQETKGNTQEIKGKVTTVSDQGMNTVILMTKKKKRYKYQRNRTRPWKRQKNK